jgi:hypothetical protein
MLTVVAARAIMVIGIIPRLKSASAAFLMAIPSSPQRKFMTRL